MWRKQILNNPTFHIFKNKNLFPLSLSLSPFSMGVEVPQALFAAKHYDLVILDFLNSFIKLGHLQPTIWIAVTNNTEKDKVILLDKIAHPNSRNAL